MGSFIQDRFLKKPLRWCLLFNAVVASVPLAVFYGLEVSKEKQKEFERQEKRFDDLLTLIQQGFVVANTEIRGLKEEQRKLNWSLDPAEITQSNKLGSINEKLDDLENEILPRIYSIKRAVEQMEENQEKFKNEILASTQKKSNELKTLLNDFNTQLTLLNELIGVYDSKAEASFIDLNSEIGENRNMITELIQNISKLNWLLDVDSEINAYKFNSLEKKIEEIQPIILQMSDSDTTRVTQYLKTLTDEMARITEQQLKPLWTKVQALETQRN